MKTSFSAEDELPDEVPIETELRHHLWRQCFKYLLSQTRHWQYTLSWGTAYSVTFYLSLSLSDSSTTTTRLI